jgi:hypothetical protein
MNEDFGMNEAISGTNLIGMTLAMRECMFEQGEVRQGANFGPWYALCFRVSDPLGIVDHLVDHLAVALVVLAGLTHTGVPEATL